MGKPQSKKTTLNISFDKVKGLTITREVLRGSGKVEDDSGPVLEIVSEDDYGQQTVTDLLGDNYVR